MNMNETLMQEMADKRAEIHQLKARNSELEKENVELKNRIANLAAEQNPANNATKVDRELSRLVSQFHDACEPTKKFNAAEGFANDQNITVRNYLKTALSNEHPTYNKKEIEAAIRAKYTALRRAYKETSNPEKPSLAQRRRTTRRHAYNSRLKVTKKTNKHQDVMAELTASGMSDLESTEGDLLKAKKPVWRSERIDLAIKELDTKVPYQKARFYGSPSTRVKK